MGAASNGTHNDASITGLLDFWYLCWNLTCHLHEGRSKRFGKQIDFPPRLS